MYLIAIGWMYVILMVSIAHPNPVGGVLTFVLAGLGPLALFLWIFGTPARRRTMARREAELESDAAEPPSSDQASAPGSSHTSDANRPVTPSRR